MRKLDFVVIGAQKSGTSTLFQLLAEHPSVFVPPGKELPFFVNAEVTAESYASFIDKHFSEQPYNVLIGKVTPHYLLHKAVAARLRALSPQTRLVVILRDPVERAFSHYRMSRRRNLDSRTFPEAIDDMLAPDELIRARALPPGRTSEHQTYVVWGEYGRMLAPYGAELERGNLLILSTRELEADPEYTMYRLFNFLEISRVKLPSIGKKVHEGGSHERIPLEQMARSIRPVRWLWRRIPLQYRSPLLWRINQWNVVKDAETVESMPAETISRLRTHYANDAAEIERLTGWHPDWAV